MLSGSDSLYVCVVNDCEKCNGQSENFSFSHSTIPPQGLTDVLHAWKSITIKEIEMMFKGTSLFQKHP